MANVIVTTTTNSISVNFGDYSSSLNIQKGVWGKIEVHKILLTGSSVDVYANSSPKWSLSHDGSNGTLQVDSIDSIAPVSLEDLYNKLKAMLE